MMPTDAFRRAWYAAVSLAAVFALAPSPARAEVQTTGPDVTVISIGSTSNWGASGGIRAYSVGTTSCNIGSQPVAWCDAGSCLGGTLQSNDHPVIAQNMYRLKDGRFSQIGMSWLKHGWLSTNFPDAACGSCTTPPGGGDQLGVGCTDTYDSGLNGGFGNPGTCAGGGDCRLGQRSEVNATTGVFPMPYTNIAHPGAIDQRLQVLESDVNPALNSGATYWVEGQYIAADDSVANNAANNASYRRVTVGASPFNLSFTGSTVREKTALDAWQVADPAVEILALDIPGSSPVEHFQVARRVSNPSPGLWHYEYAVRNTNSDRAAQALTIDFPDGATISNAGFRDIDHHSDEPYATTDWTIAIDAPTAVVSWTGVDFATNSNANALRFATMFNFWFDADAPAAVSHTLAFFKPGTPPSVSFWADASLFADGFESNDTSAWSATVP